MPRSTMYTPNNQHSRPIRTPAIAPLRKNSKLKGESRLFTEMSHRNQSTLFALDTVQRLTIDILVSNLSSSAALVNSGKTSQTGLKRIANGLINPNGLSLSPLPVKHPIKPFPNARGPFTLADATAV